MVRGLTAPTDPGSPISCPKKRETRSALPAKRVALALAVFGSDAPPPRPQADDQIGACGKLPHKAGAVKPGRAPSAVKSRHQLARLVGIVGAPDAQRERLDLADPAAQDALLDGEQLGGTHR